MKIKFRKYIKVFLTLSGSLLILSNSIYAQQSGTVTFQVRTVSYGGKYADKNIGAIWVENSQSQFVKTLKVWARKRIKNLIKWKAASGQNVVDAVTGATIRTHETHNVTWDCTDINGAVVPDGSYKLIVEFTEHDATKSSAPPGKWTSVEFLKGASAQTINPPDESYFKDIKLVYTPSNSSPLSSMSGTVKNATTNNPLPDAVIQLKSGNVVQFETKSNVSGLYNFNGIQAGSYTIYCFKNGYEAWTEGVTFNAGDQITGKNILLTPHADKIAPAPPVNVRVNTTN